MVSEIGIIAAPDGDGSADASRPVVSIVVPIFNRAENLPGLIGTISAQTISDWEAIIVDDASTQDLAGAVEPFLADPRIRYLRLERNGGPATARNRGVDISRGRYVAFLDSDDEWAPTKLERQIAALEDKPEGPAFCVTLTTIMMPGGWSRVRPNFDPRPGQTFGEYLYRDGGFAQASSLFLPRELALRVRFVESMRQYEDHLYFIQLDMSGARYVLVREPLTIWQNDARPGRLSSRDDMQRGAVFLDKARGMLTPEVETAFQLRVLAGPLLRERPLTAWALVVKALIQRALSLKQLTVVVVRHILPPSVWERLRRHDD